MRPRVDMDGLPELDHDINDLFDILLTDLIHTLPHDLPRCKSAGLEDMPLARAEHIAALRYLLQAETFRFVLEVIYAPRLQGVAVDYLSRASASISAALAALIEGPRRAWLHSLPLKAVLVQQ
eukprot:766723-Hanusia_phi.AAC.2